MSDATVAEVARRLASALSKAGYERDLQSKKEVAALNTELCQAVRAEAAEPAEKPG